MIIVYCRYSSSSNRVSDPLVSDPSKFDIDTTLKAVELFQGREKCGKVITKTCPCNIQRFF